MTGTRTYPAATTTILIPASATTHAPTLTVTVTRCWRSRGCFQRLQRQFDHLSRDMIRFLAALKRSELMEPRSFYVKDDDLSPYSKKKVAKSVRKIRRRRRFRR